MFDFNAVRQHPLFYYILVPAALAVWPLWLAAAGLPAAKSGLQKDIVAYQEAEKLIEQILKDLDPQRLDYARENKSAAQFDYTTAIDQLAKGCGISPSGYKLSSSPIRNTRAGQKSQDASIIIDKITVATLAKFLSTAHTRWAGLKCTNLTLSKIKGEKDLWKADIRFVYYQ